MFIWDLKIGEKFCLTESGYNKNTDRQEIYVKISRSKCVLDSHPDKLIFSIAKLCKSMQAVGYKLIETFEMEEDG